MVFTAVLRLTRHPPNRWSDLFWISYILKSRQVEIARIKRVVKRTVDKKSCWVLNEPFSLESRWLSFKFNIPTLGINFKVARPIHLDTRKLYRAITGLIFLSILSPYLFTTPIFFPQRFFPCPHREKQKSKNNNTELAGDHQPTSGRLSATRTHKKNDTLKTPPKKRIACRPRCPIGRSPLSAPAKPPSPVRSGRAHPKPPKEPSLLKKKHLYPTPTPLFFPSSSLNSLMYCFNRFFSFTDNPDPEFLF